MALSATQFCEITKLLETASNYSGSLQWINKPGDLIFTAPKDIADPKCRYVVMGYNPGGSADEKKQKNLRQSIESLQSNASNGNDKGNIAGWSDIMQDRFNIIKQVMADCEFKGEPTGVNLFPYPSSGVNEFKTKTRNCGCTIENMFKSIWPVHEYLLKQTDASILLALGYGLRDSVLALLKQHYKVDKLCFDASRVRAFKVPDTDLPLRYVIGLHHIAWRNVGKESLSMCIRECRNQGLH